MHLGGLEMEHLENVEPIGSETDSRFAATDLKLDRRVAVRLLPPVASGDDGTRFLDRARALAGLSWHPNIVTVFDAGLTPEERPYVVTELTDGPDLATKLEVEGSLTWPEACEVVLQLAAGLEQIHQGGGRHRDLRPETIVLAGSTARLTEAGLIPAPRPTDTPTTLTHRAPETFAGDGDARSDLYSLTSMLYELIDGRAPFWRPNDTAETLRARVETQAAPPLDPELVPQALAVFVTAGLSSDPLDRPQHIGEFVGELRVIAEDRSTDSTPSVLHTVSGSVPAVASATPIAPPTPPSWPALASAAAAPAPVAAVAAVTSQGPVGPGDAVPTWALSTAELTVSGDQSLPAPAEAWAPPPPTGLTATIEPPAITEPAAFARPSPPFDEAPGRPEGLHDHTTLIPTIDTGAGPPQGPDRRPLLMAAAAMIAIGLVGLLAVVAVGLRGSDTDAEAAPVLQDPNAPTEAALGDPSEASPTTLTPLAMLPESTTTTASDEMVTSTDPTIRRVVVPNLVDLDVAVAGQRLSDLGVEVLVVGRVSQGATPGAVIQQTPAAGSTIELPATVTLFIPRSATLPSMVGRPADTVCLQLTAFGLRCEQVLRFDDRIAPGAVIATDPAEGAAFADGQTIRIDVSRGPLAEVRIPPVAGLTEADARAFLGQVGFITLTVASRPSNNVPAGQAIGTDPATGTSLTIDQPVTIQISSGPAPMVAVPDLVGLDRAAAEAALGQAQLTGTFVTSDLPAGDPNIGRVLAVNPAPATQVPAGSAVTVTIGQAMAGSTTTTAPSTGPSTTAAGGG